MIPYLNINDFVIASHSVPLNSLKVRDIMVFKTYETDASKQHKTIVRRVAQIVTDPGNGQRVIRTKGDANPDSIPGLDYPIFQPLYIGNCWANTVRVSNCKISIVVRFRRRN
jgi:signal peptidase